MSLLPQQVPQPSAPIGYWLAPGGERIPVVIDQTWWLLLFQFSNLILGDGNGLTSDALQDLANADMDAADSDAIALRQPLANALVQLPEDLPATPPADLAQALLLAQDGLLPDAAPGPQPIASITVSASPFAYTAPVAGHVTVTGGTVSAISLTRQGTAIPTGLITGLIPICRGDVVTVTYSATPTMKLIPWSNA